MGIPTVMGAGFFATAPRPRVSVSGSVAAFVAAWLREVCLFVPAFGCQVKVMIGGEERVETPRGAPCGYSTAVGYAGRFTPNRALRLTVWPRTLRQMREHLAATKIRHS